MKNFILTILVILLFVLITVCAGIFKPQLTMRTFNAVPEMVVNSDFQPAPDPKITPETTKSQNKTSKSLPVRTKIVEKTIIVHQPAPATTQTTPKKQKTEQKPPQPKSTEVLTPPTVQKPAKQLTEAEELIVWNKWHSDLQNQIMQDSKIYSPRGTVFRFSCTVDKNRRISNIKVWSDTTNTQPGDIYRIKTVISGYQNNAILEFPAGTKRIIANFSGGFTVGTDSRYSRPEDYSDVEKIKIRG